MGWVYGGAVGGQEGEAVGDFPAPPAGRPGPAPGRSCWSRCRRPCSRSAARSGRRAPPGRCAARFPASGGSQWDAASSMEPGVLTSRPRAPVVGQGRPLDVGVIAVLLGLGIGYVLRRHRGAVAVHHAVMPHIPVALPGPAAIVLQLLQTGPEHQGEAQPRQVGAPSSSRVPEKSTWSSPRDESGRRSGRPVWAAGPRGPGRPSAPAPPGRRAAGCRRPRRSWSPPNYNGRSCGREFPGSRSSTSPGGYSGRCRWGAR